MPDGSEFRTAGAAMLKPWEAKIVRTQEGVLWINGDRISVNWPAQCTGLSGKWLLQR